MKRYIEVQRHVAGRTITQRHPARHVGTQPPGVLGTVDLTCLECGFVECECPGGGWPPPVAPEPSAVVLSDEPYGCVNRTTDSPRECVESGHYWCDLSKTPAEPALRAGLDDPKAEPKCKVCGSTLGLGPHMQFFNHAYEPEEPGHG